MFYLVEGTKDNPFRTDNNGNQDPFDIFGELPESQTVQQPQSQDNIDHNASFHDLLSNSTAISASTPGMAMNGNSVRNKSNNNSHSNNGNANYHDFGVNNFDNMFNF